jgi:ferredoxin
MRIIADRELCEGHGVCVAQAPTLLDLDDDEIVVVLEPGESLSEDDASRARVAVESCPVAALRVVDA